MKKKTYFTPITKVAHINSENLMLIASPGVGGDYDTTEPIDAKGSDFFEEDGIWSVNNVWDK